MRRIASYLTGPVAAVALLTAPVAAQANTRAQETATHALQSDDDDFAAGALPQDETRRKSRDWLLVLFGSMATIGALAILLSGQSGGSDGPVQSNGAT